MKKTALLAGYVILSLSLPAYAEDTTNSGFGENFAGTEYSGFSDPEVRLMAMDKMDPETLNTIEPAAGNENTDKTTETPSIEAPKEIIEETSE